METLDTILFAACVLFILAGIAYTATQVIWVAFLQLWDRFIVDLYKREVE